MARQAKLRKKNGYWMTKADGAETSFRKTSELARRDAWLWHVHDNLHGEYVWSIQRWRFKPATP